MNYSDSDTKINKSVVSEKHNDTIKYIIKNIFPYFVLISATYSTNIAIIILGYIDLTIFPKIALFIGIINLMFSILGGSLRHNKIFLNISIIELSQLINIRILFSVLVLLLLFIFELSFVLISFIIRRLSEWIIDPYISDRSAKYYDIIIVSTDSLALILCFLIFNNTNNGFSFVLWSFMPLIYLLDLEGYEIKLSNIFNKKINHLFLFGYDGFAAISSLFFRYIIYVIDEIYAAETLYYTMIYGFSAGFFVKIIAPANHFIYKNIINVIYSRVKILFDLILLIIMYFILFSLMPFQLLMFFSTLLIVSALYRRQIYLFNSKNKSKVFMFEIYINLFVFLLFGLLIIINQEYVIYYFFMNAIINYYFYRIIK